MNQGCRRSWERKATAFLLPCLQDGGGVTQTGFIPKPTTVWHRKIMIPDRWTVLQSQADPPTRRSYCFFDFQVAETADIICEIYVLPKLSQPILVSVNHIFVFDVKIRISEHICKVYFSRFKLNIAFRLVLHIKCVCIFDVKARFFSQGLQLRGVAVAFDSFVIRKSAAFPDKVDALGAEAALYFFKHSCFAI